MTQQISKKTGHHRIEGWQPDRTPGGRPRPLLSQTPGGSLHALPLTGAIATADLRNQRVTILLPTTLIERLRNAIYWTEQHTMTRVITDAIHDAVAEMEQVNGGIFPLRLTPLKRGRPRRAPLPQRLPPTEPLL
ncbi:MAG: hypothetical protein HOP35_18150 [Nitrospira sp.]|nr:hypothetical protein [Nitrospira sp.]